MDPVTLAVVRGALSQIADEMDLHLIHAALSPIISETNDCAHGIYDPVSGETIAQGGYGLPQFLTLMQFTVQNIVKVAEREGGFKPGDMWIVNNPYLSGTHLQDVILVSPYFVEGKLFALLANTGHWMDIGGSTPGGWAPKAQEVHQEGIVIPPLKLYDEGRLNEPIVRMIRANIRLPDQIAGDLAAMANVFAVGRRGLDELVARYGVATLQECITEMMARSEAEMRSYIEELPDGVYEMQDCFDNDGIEDKVLPVVVKATVKGSSLHFDFTGTAPAAKGPMNMSESTTRSLCYVAVKHLFPEVPINGGAFRPITFTIPEGTIFNARYPSPCNGYTEVVQRVIDVCFGALAKAMPSRTPAAPFGTTGVCTMSGRHPATGRYYVAVYPYPGGYGGTAETDGLVNGTPPGSMASFMSIEMSEHRYPIRFGRHAIRDDSGGPGRHRGGCGTTYAITALADCVVSILGDRVDHAPFGIEGGESGAPNRVVFNTGGKAWQAPLRSKYDKLDVKPGESVEFFTPGGGGFGRPTERPLDAVAEDLDRGFVSREIAEARYGVVVAEEVPVGRGRARFRLDPEASARRRKELAEGRRSAP